MDNKEKESITNQQKIKSDLVFKVNLGAANKFRIIYLGISFLLMFGSIYKVSFMGYTESFTIMQYAFLGINAGLVYFLILILAFAIEVVVGLQENETIRTNKQVINLGLPLILLICSVLFLLKGFSIKRESMCLSSVSLGLFVIIAIHLGFLVYTKFPEKIEEVVRDVRSKQS